MKILFIDEGFLKLVQLVEARPYIRVRQGKYIQVLLLTFSVFIRVSFVIGFE